MSESGGKKWGRGVIWSLDETEFVLAHPELSDKELSALMRGRSWQAIHNLRCRQAKSYGPESEQPAVKAPGDYVEHLASYLVDDFECMEIWTRWNGYSSFRELSRDDRGWVTVLCQAK